MKIDLKETLERDIRGGMNLFLGAGFSIYAKDFSARRLPLGAKLCDELVAEFNCPDIKDLPKICTIIDSYNSAGLKNYLLSRFKVDTYESFYDNLLYINSPRIFTTNIDNLVDKIYEKSDNKYLNNIFINGSCFNDSRCIDYIPLHGTVENEENKFLFNVQEVSASFRTQRTAWASLSIAADQIPSLFLGYSLSDVDAIESLFGDRSDVSIQKNKWIVLQSENPGNEAYFKALGFKIIIADIKEFLTYVGTLQNTETPILNKSKDYIYEIFPSSRIPVGTHGIKIRSIDEFFLGDSPIWSDIISNRIYSTSHIDEIINRIEQPNNLIITGIPASGKSTIMLQLAKQLSKTKRVLLFSDLTINKTNIIRNEISTPTIILVDNFTNDIDAFINLAGNGNIKLVGFDRYYDVDISAHRIDGNKFQFYDVSDLTPQDIQGIYNTIPLGMRKSPMVSKANMEDIPSIFEIVNFNINKTSINDRYRPILSDLENNDPQLLDLLIMTCYLHSCRIPVSFEVANSFLWDDVSSYTEVMELMNSLKGMVNEVIGTVIDDDNIQDYYQPRSQILAETIIEQTSSTIFRRVYEKFHNNVPKHLIPNYKVFKRNAYDAYYATKAFSNWQEGLEFYEEAFLNDSTPFILQQCALYLVKKRRFTEAALKIDKALQISRKRFFSIENTHAMILFKANINTTLIDQTTRDILDKSMKILISCYQLDERKTFHAITFAEQSLDYFTRFPDDKGREYLTSAKKWLSEIKLHVERKYNHRVKNLLESIEKAL